MNTPAHRAAFIACGSENHSLSNVTGYHVRVTINDEGNTVNGPVIAVVDGPTHYSEALESVYAYRKAHPKGYALIDNIYACGHSDADWHWPERAEVAS